MKVWSVWTAVVLMVASIGASPAWAVGPFDGEWQVTLTTKTGPCRIADFPLTIRDGAMSGFAAGAQRRYEIKGRVRHDGNFSWGWGHATGTLAGNAGSGQWVTTAGAIAQNCSGDITLQHAQ